MPVKLSQDNDDRIRDPIDESFAAARRRQKNPPADPPPNGADTSNYGPGGYGSNPNETRLRRPYQAEDAPDAMSRVKNLGDTHWDDETARFNARQHQAAGNPTDPRGNDEASGDASDPRNELARSEEKAGRSIGRQNESIGTQEQLGGWGVDVTPGGKAKASPLLTRLKKKRNIFILAIAIGASVGGVSLFLTAPAALLVIFKEFELGKFGDRQQTLTQKRLSRIVLKQMTTDPLTAGCNTIAVKCRYKGMTEKEIDKFESRNGGTEHVQIDTDGKNLLGRYKIKSIGFEDDSGNFRTMLPKEFKSLIKTDFNFQKLIYNYNNASVADWRDSPAGKLFGKLGINWGDRKSNKSPPETEAEAEDLAKTDNDARIAANAETSATIESAIKKTNVFGVLCAVKSLIAASKDVAKIELAAKLVAFAAPFLNEADAIKSGATTGDSGSTNQIAALSTTLTTPDENGQTASDSFGAQYAESGVLTKDRGNQQNYQMGSQADTGVIGQITSAAKSIAIIAAIGGVTSVILNKTLCKIVGNDIATAAFCAGSIAADFASFGAAAAFSVVLCISQQLAISKLIGIALPFLLGKVVKTTDLSGIVGGDAGNALTGGVSELASLDARFHGGYPLTKPQAVKYDTFSDNAQGGGAYFGSALDFSNPDSFAGKLAMAFVPPLAQVSSSLANLLTALAGLSMSSLASVSASADARSVIPGEYDQCDDSDYASLNMAVDPFCVPQFGLDPSMVLGDDSYNQPVAAVDSSPKSNGFSLASLFSTPTASAATDDDTRGFTPDNRFDADSVLAFMCGQSVDDSTPCNLWIDDDGNPIPHTSGPNANDDYQAYLNDCLQSTDPIGPDSPDMCKPKDCVDASSTSDTFRYCMYSQYAMDDGINDQLEDKDAQTGGSSASDTTTSQTTPTTIDPSTLYNSSTNVPCAAGTNDLGVQDGYHDGTKVQIHICAVANLPSSGEEANGGYGVTGADGKCVVNAVVSGAVSNLVDAAKQDGLTLTSSSCFRTMAHQQALCTPLSGCAGGDYTTVAKPGTSNHQMGLAVDYTMANPAKFDDSVATCVDVGGRCEAPGDAVWEWLDKNAPTFGFQPYSAEYWHWSPTGN